MAGVAMSNPIPHPARYEARRSPDGSVCVFDSFRQEPVSFEERVTTMSQAIGAAGRLNRAYAMACMREEA